LESEENNSGSEQEAITPTIEEEIS